MRTQTFLGIFLPKKFRKTEHKEDHKAMTVKTIQVGNAVVEIIRPELSDEERQKREDRVMAVLSTLQTLRKDDKKYEYS